MGLLEERLVKFWMVGEFSHGWEQRVIAGVAVGMDIVDRCFLVPITFS